MLLLYLPHCGQQEPGGYTPTQLDGTIGGHLTFSHLPSEPKPGNN